MRQDTLPVRHFEALYTARPDPWHYETSAYERGKYAATLRALPRERYCRGFEVGCANGVFTAMLARRCDALVAAEPAVTAREAARYRLRDEAHVRVEDHWVPRDWPDGSFDLIVISEVVDYLGKGDLIRLGERMAGSLDPGGDVILVHWIGKKRGPPSGREASDLLIRSVAGEMNVLHAERTPDYRVDVLGRLRAVPTG